MHSSLLPARTRRSHCLLSENERGVANESVGGKQAVEQKQGSEKRNAKNTEEIATALARAARVSTDQLVSAAAAPASAALAKTAWPELLGALETTQPITLFPTGQRTIAWVGRASERAGQTFPRRSSDQK